jgi:hypothetical protein
MDTARSPTTREEFLERLRQRYRSAPSAGTNRSQSGVTAAALHKPPARECQRSPDPDASRGFPTPDGCRQSTSPPRGNGRQSNPQRANLVALNMGKASKKRHCPAIDGPITPVECGERRVSVYACPESCRYNPFAPANYDQLLRVDDELQRKALDRLFRAMPDREAIEQYLQEARKENPQHGLSARINWDTYFQTDADGRTLIQAWEQDGFVGLKNDERVVLRARAQLRVALLEVRQIPDLETVEVVDLLAPAQPPFILRDRKLAASAVRFLTLLAWIHPLPHFWVAFGSAIELPDNETYEPLEVVTEIVQHLGGPVDEPGMRRFLAQNFARFDRALLAVSVTWRRQLFATTDAKLGRAVYELRRPFAECTEVLDQQPEVEEDALAEGERAEGFADARIWTDPEPVAKEVAGDATPVLLGRVLLGQSHWRLEAFGAATLAQLRLRFEAHLGDRVRFTGQRLDDFAVSMAEKEPKIDESLVPPRLRETKSQMRISVKRVQPPIQPKSLDELGADWMAAQDRAWLDAPVPALDGKTPRAAAQNPALRPRLIRLMKSRIRTTDQRNLRSGGREDVNWMIRELGLQEILFPPPPPRPPLEESESDDEHSLEDDESMENAGADLPFAPPPPRRPFTEDEVYEAIHEAMHGYESTLDAIRDLEAEGSWLIGEIAELTESLLTQELYALIVPAILRAWRVFVPREMRGSVLDMRRLTDTIGREVQGMRRVAETNTSSDFDRYLKSGPQPDLAFALSGLVLSAAERLPSKDQPDPNHLAIAVAVLRAVIEEIDTACREH